MKLKLTTISLCRALACAIIVSGCSKSDVNPSAALDTSKISVAVNQAFGAAPDQIRQAATNYVAALEGQDAAGAFVQLRKLSAENDLTPHQREVIAKSMQATFKKLQAAAEGGNSAAQSVMHQYLSTR